MTSGGGHKERKHSKFSASGAERWHNCSGSVALSEGLPDKSSSWAEEGTLAHEVLESILSFARVRPDITSFFGEFPKKADEQMISHASSAAGFILGVHKGLPDSEVLVETRITLDFIHPEMFGTFDAAVIDHFDTLHVFDYKYGMTAVSPVQNLQMIFYGLGLAYKHQWNFKKVRLWIIQPRVKGYDGPTFWELSMQELVSYAKIFREAVGRVKHFPNKYVEGSWCHWCKAKTICPLKREAKIEKAKEIFLNNPIDQDGDFEGSFL